MSEPTLTPKREHKPPQLPPELIAQIISLAVPLAHVAKPLQPRYDLLSTLCLVNRTWRALAQPHFFTHVAYDWKNNRLARLEEAVEGNQELAVLARGAQVVRLGTTDPTVNGGEFGGGAQAGGFDTVFRLHPKISTLWLDWSRSPSVSDLVPFKGTHFLQHEK